MMSVTLGVGVGIDQFEPGSASGPPLDRTLFSDTFTRTDSLTLDNAETGQPWTLYGGATYGITNGEAYCIAGQGDDNFAGYDSLQSDCEIEMVFSKLGGEQWRSFIAFRASSSTTYVMVQAETTRWTIQDHKGGGWFEAAQYLVPPVNGDRINVIMNGSDITVKLNDAVIMTAVISSNLTNTIHGFHSRGIGYANSSVGSFKIMTL